MTPGILNTPIYQGGQYQHLLTIRIGGVASILTGLSPFVCTVSHPKRKEAITTFTVTDTDLANGKITITGTPEETAIIPLGFARISLKDNQGNPYIANTVPVLFFDPDA